tara:strand:- start:712 stop:1053 length:342 start_codon:yes stop_codon:yes gene_type:complete
MIKNDVNKINTPTWVKMNDDAQSVYARKIFVEMYGGEFKKNNTGMHVWVENKKEDFSKETSRYVIETAENGFEYAENLSEYCRKNGLNKAAMYGTYRGDRKHHKGNKLIKIPN